MPVDTPKSPGKTPGKGGKIGGKGGFKIGPYNGYLVIGGAVVAIFLGLYLRNKFSNTSGSSTTTPTSTDPGSSGGGGSVTPSSDTTSAGLADSINGLTGLLGAGIPVNVTLDQAGVVSPAAVTNPDTSGGSSSISPVNQPAAAATSQTVTGTPGPTATPSQAAAITAASQSALGFFGGGSTAGSTPAPAASTGFFGSIASSAGTAVKATQATTLATTVPSTASNVKTLANGAVTYVAKNGNTIEVAPGKTPYVIKKAK